MRKCEAETTLGRHGLVAGRQIGRSRRHVTEHAEFERSVVVPEIEAGQIKIEERRIIRVVERSAEPVWAEDGGGLCGRRKRAREILQLCVLDWQEWGGLNLNREVLDRWRHRDMMVRVRRIDPIHAGIGLMRGEEGPTRIGMSTHVWRGKV